MAKKKSTARKTKASTSRKRTTKKKAAPARKKTTKKASTTKKKTAKKVAKKKVTKKKAAAKKVTKKKATKKKATKKKVAKKVTKKTTKKKTTKKKTTKKTTKSKAPVKAEEAPAKPSGKSKLKQGSGGRRKKVVSVSALRGYDKYLPTAATQTNGRGSDELPVNQLKRIKSGLARKEVNHYRSQLLMKRSELLGDVQSLEVDAKKEEGEGISYEHMADAGSDNFEQEFTLGLAEEERKLLHRINGALERIQEGYYGVCVVRGVPIGKSRLDAKPWAKYSIEVAREKERLGQI